MLLFKPEHIKPILNGTKTQTRRLWKHPRARIGAVHQCRTELFGKPFAKVEILKVYRQRFHDMRNEDVDKEGFECLTDFINTIQKINKLSDKDIEILSAKGKLGDRNLYVVEFKLVEAIEKIQK